MAIINNNRPTLNRKEWQMMTPAPVTTAAAMNAPITMRASKPSHRRSGGCELTSHAGTICEWWQQNRTVAALVGREESAYERWNALAAAGTLATKRRMPRAAGRTARAARSRDVD